MRVTLTGQGYEVDDAKNGEAALEKLREHRFDLMLLDMNMPGMSGLETCRAVREQSEIAIIMLTVRDTETDKVEALSRACPAMRPSPRTPLRPRTPAPRVTRPLAAPRSARPSR